MLAFAQHSGEAIRGEVDRRLLAALTRDRQVLDHMADDSRRALALSWRALKSEFDPFQT